MISTSLYIIYLAHNRVPLLTDLMYLQQSLFYFFIARVKQKSFKKMVGHNDVHCIQDPEIVEKRPLPINDEILAIEYQDDGCKHQEEGEEGDHQPEEIAIVSRNIESDDKSSKRKWSDGDSGITESSKYTSLLFL